MPQLDEVLTKASVEGLHKKFLEGVDYLPRTERGDFGLSSQTFDEVGEVICEFVHRRMWDNSVPASPEYRASGYMRRSRVTPFSVLFQAGAIKSSDLKNPRLSADIARVLTRSGLLRKIKGTNAFVLRPWNPASLQYVSAYRKPDPKEDKRIAEEADKPVRSITDLRVIKMPDSPTPDAILAFIERFVPAALKIQAERDDLKAQLEAEAQKAEEASLWSKASDRIGELLK